MLDDPGSVNKMATQPLVRDEIPRNHGIPESITKPSRRPPAHLSVSLRQPAKEQGPDSVPEGMQYQSTFKPFPSPSSRKRRRINASSSVSLPKESTQDSGESGTAERWFENSNNHVGESLKSSFVNDDPPYYMVNASSSSTGMDDYEPPMDRRTGPSLHPQTSLMASPKQSPLVSSTSNSDDYRSVIDDLTVQNKKLKRRLRKFEDLHCTQLENEKLFEVRIHGLPPEKRRELEETLRSFAATLGDKTPQSSSTSKVKGTASASHISGLRKASTSSTSESRVVDSAYASMSTSGQTLAGLMSQASRDKPHSILRMTPRDTRKQPSLYDIPEGFLPQHAAVMTEKAKKKLVVRRLEQLFTGKLAAKSGHKQPLQQQEISTAAAKADRNALEALGHKINREGIREARILPQSAELAADALGSGPSEGLSRVESHSSDSSSHGRSADATPSTGGSPQQRPTRPLDLDPYRAQVPAENIEYIRHLGFSPPPTTQADPSSDAAGWVYLNVLTNMAQLHTINVTSNFVKRAVMEYSDQFELSADEQRVRWKGGNQGTCFSSDSGSANDAESLSSPDGWDVSATGAVETGLLREDSSGSNDTVEMRVDSALGNARLGKTIHTQTDNSAKGASVIHGESATQFDYRPLIFRESSEEDFDDSSYGSDSIASSASLGPRQTPSRTNNRIGTSDSKISRKHRDGAIIFYNEAKFCTDLCGDRYLAGPSRSQSIAYNRFTRRPLGYVSSRPRQGSCSSSDDDSVRPSFSERLSSGSMDVDYASLPSDMFSFSPRACSTASDMPEPRMPFKLEACGIGNIRPADNFTLNVHTRHDTTSISPFSAPKSSRIHKFLHNIPPKSIEAFRDDCGEPELDSEKGIRTATFDPPVKSKILSISRADHHPSSLPSPSYLYPSTSSDGDGTSSLDESDTSCGESESVEYAPRPSISMSSQRTRSQHQQRCQPHLPSFQPSQAIDSSVYLPSSSTHIINPFFDATKSQLQPVVAAPTTAVSVDLDAPVHPGSSSAATVGDDVSVAFRYPSTSTLRNLKRASSSDQAPHADGDDGDGNDGNDGNTSWSGRESKMPKFDVDHS